MKKNYIKIIACLSLIALAGCTETAPTSNTGNGTTSTPSTNPNTSVEITKTNADFTHARTTYNDQNGDVQNLNMNTLYRNSSNPHLDPIKDQNVLVIPFGFTDYTHVQTKDTLERIETAFFGTDEEIAAVGGWKSVSSYYNESSRGKSKFKGKVVPNWCVYNGSSSDFATAYGGDFGVNAAKNARTWYISEYAKENHGLLGADAEPLSYYDQDNDGFIDLLWVVYSVPFTPDTQWWAYVTYDQFSSPSTNKETPNVKTLGWASINFMNKGFNGYDAHTFIHETGHTYGLDDYYDYSNSWSPFGGIDMMDHNVGDHCSFSKFTLGWVNPLVVNDSATITLKPTTDTSEGGDSCFIIPSPNYNGTAFDEYMMVEFIAPVGLNEKDYKNGYEGTQGYSQSGIRISHVDARVVKNLGNNENYLTNNPEEGLEIKVCNTKGGRAGTDTNYFPVKDLNDKIVYRPYALNSLIESFFDEKSNILTSKINASNQSLFGKYSTFSLEEGSKWAKTYMPSQSNLWNKAKTMTGGTLLNQTYTIDETCTFNYKIRVKSIASDNSSAQITVTKIA